MKAVTAQIIIKHGEQPHPFSYVLENGVDRLDMAGVPDEGGALFVRESSVRYDRDTNTVVLKDATKGAPGIRVKWAGDGSDFWDWIDNGVLKLDAGQYDTGIWTGADFILKESAETIAARVTA